MCHLLLDQDPSLVLRCQFMDNETVVLVSAGSWAFRIFLIVVEIPIKAMATLYGILVRKDKLLLKILRILGDHGNNLRNLWWKMFSLSYILTI